VAASKVVTERAQDRAKEIVQEDVQTLAKALALVIAPEDVQTLAKEIAKVHATGLVLEVAVSPV